MAFSAASQALDGVGVINRQHHGKAMMRPVSAVVAFEPPQHLGQRVIFAIFLDEAGGREGPHVFAIAASGNQGMVSDLGQGCDFAFASDPPHPASRS
ncbi:hypothetical protein ACFPL7_22360 [Dongia soli]|uniref:Uncharacterized protein n=1 Tax=Dongia soli TaxID=600628 RepID=A0ABU5E9P9_9PROT|nr:hypothetical protein [Dongia soli]MDY0882335.1 hypothetical protein [Dongia soli]